MEYIINGYVNHETEYTKEKEEFLLNWEIDHKIIDNNILLITFRNEFQETMYDEKFLIEE